jgi:signal transduction histidine kinase/ActR/RegA family two-component response regulator
MRESLGRMLHDIVQVLESAEGFEERTLRVVELLKRIVPYEQCALYCAQPGREPRLFVLPATPPEVRATILETLVHLHGRLVDERSHPPKTRTKDWGAHLAVSLVGNDQVFGVLFVSGPSPDGSAGQYTEQHLRELSIIGSHLAAYLVMVDQARAIDEARREADKANRMKDEFLALVSRGLKTPLMSTLAWAHMLGSEDNGAVERTRAVEAIERNVHAQAKLIDEILDLSCIMAADLRLDLQGVEPATLIKAAVAQQRVRAERRSVQLETTLDESIIRLVVDPVRIVQVISNLLANAIQATPSGGQVGVHLERAGVHARIQVIDHGKGIPAEVLPHMFESFRAGANPVTRTYGELGGGLAIVKPLVEAHGGRVRAESSGGELGSTFTIELPLQAEPPTVSRNLLKGIRVLLVDDDEDMRIAAAAVLQHYGAEVKTVASAAAALTELERSKPHVLLSDLSMPGESGYDLMRKVAAHDATMPSAALTSFGRPEDKERALAAGFRMHLSKPVEAKALVAAVATLSGRTIAKSLEAAITR